MRAVVWPGWAAVRRRRLQSLVIGVVVLLSSGTALLGLGLLVASNAPFNRAFTYQQGAHATASFDPAKVSRADLAATTDRPGVTAAAGPFDTVRAQLVSESAPLPTGLIVGRADAASTVDRLDLTDGRWLTGPGQIVLSRDAVDDGGNPYLVGSRITVDVVGRPSLQVVGIADSVTGTADAWVWLTQTDVLHAEDAAASRQMLYRFASAGGETAIRASLNQATTALPDDALTGASTYLTAKLRAEGTLKPMVPFVVAFAVLGLVMSVLIVVNVVAGAVVAGFRTIGVQKTLGFTPGQVVGRVRRPDPGGVRARLPAGRGARLAAGHTAAGRDRPRVLPLRPGERPRLDPPGGAAGHAGDRRAGRGRGGGAGRSAIGGAGDHRRSRPRSGRGFRIRRALAATRLPRPVSFGLGARRPPGRPAPRRPSSPCCSARPQWCSPPGWRPHCPGCRPASAGPPPYRSRLKS